MNFMNQAFLLAKKAQLHGDVPIGAVIVKDGKIIARGENRIKKSEGISPRFFYIFYEITTQ